MHARDQPIACLHRRVLLYALMWGVASCTPDVTAARARVETLLHEEVCVHVLGSEQEARTLLLDDVEKANASLFDVKLDYRTCMFALWSNLDTVARSVTVGAGMG